MLSSTWLGRVDVFCTMFPANPYSYPNTTPATVVFVHADIPGGAIAPGILNPKPGAAYVVGVMVMHGHQNPRYP